MQRIVPGIVETFRPIKEVMASQLLHVLLEEPATDKGRHMPASSLPVCHGGLGLMDTLQTCRPCHDSSLAMASMIQASLPAPGPLLSGFYRVASRLDKSSQENLRDEEANDWVVVLREESTPSYARRMLRSKNTGSWLTCMPDLLNWTHLSAN